ncbi:MAG: hypothetical protein IKX48_08445, partial [Victivallales bacterium]|nr:hypothetical protein [Victivallales bacterium]
MVINDIKIECRLTSACRAAFFMGGSRSCVTGRAEARPSRWDYCWNIRKKMVQFQESFDVIVVGAGHAGCEAALA